MQTPGFLTDDECWAALTRRHGGSFLYGVRTTGIYCRPGCPSRLPRRENTLFFPGPEQAEAAGYRACRKCRPGSPDALPEAVSRACALLREMEEPPRLDALAAAVGLSPGHLHRIFRAAVGVTPRAYADAVRLERLGAALGQEPTVAAAIYEAGYGSGSGGYRAAAALGMAPSALRRGAPGQVLRFAAVETSLGWAGIAATERGICHVALGDNPEALRAEVRARFHRAELVEGDAEFQGWVEAVVGTVETPGSPRAVPLEIAGTAFQHRVWEALRALAPGQTATYAEIAARVGRPSAARAVARACAANQLAVVVPCHRVVRADGDPGGYRWDPERKRRLLERETP